jgi:hypothetical protein
MKFNKITEKYWLHDGTDTDRLIDDILYLQDTHIFTAYAAEAEAECFIDLKLDPMKFKWLCARVMSTGWAHSSSQFARFAEQKALREGKGFRRADIHTGIDFKNEKSKDKAKKKSYNSLVGMLEFGPGIQRSADTKQDMIDLIISKDAYTEEEKKSILDYCEEDVRDLPAMCKWFVETNVAQYAKTSLVYEKQDYLSLLVNQSRFCAISARYKRNGIPLDTEMIKKVDSAKDGILNRIRELANNNLPASRKFYVEEFSSKSAEKYYGLLAEGKQEEADKIASKLVKIERKITLCKENVNKFIEENNFAHMWPKTSKSKEEKPTYKTDEDTLKDLQHLHPKISDLRQAIKTTNALKMFSTGSFYEHVDLVRATQHPYWGIFGTLTSRNAATAKSFIMAQASWCRAIMRAKKGHSIVSLDFTAQEVYIAACISGDDNMLQAYLSGDPYLAFGKQAKFIKQTETKESAGTLRTIAKTVVLGILFGMGPKMTAFRCNITLKEAQYYHHMHEVTYRKYHEWKRTRVKNHEINNVSVLSDGFLIFDNRAHKDTDKYKKGQQFSLTTVNSGIQGEGAVIMRDTTDMCIQQNVPVIYTLHDEIASHVLDRYVERVSEIMKECAIKATSKIFPGRPPIRVDISITSHDELYVEDKAIPALKSLQEYLDIRWVEENHGKGKFIRI